MVMGFVIASFGPTGDVTDQPVSGNLELSDLYAGSLYCHRVKASGLDVGYKIGFPNGLHTPFIPVVLDREKILFAFVAVRKLIRIIKYKVRIMKHIHDHRCIGHRQKPNGLAATVNQTMPGVDRRGKET